MPWFCSTQKNPDDVVITLAIRTPLAKAFKGGFKDTDLDYMVYTLLKKVVEMSNLDPSIVEDICLGNVRQKQASLLLSIDVLMMTTGQRRQGCFHYPCSNARSWVPTYGWRLFCQPLLLLGS
jgi:Thiolase, N-terminal domain